MNVEHVTGDLLDFPAGINVIAHCCNLQRQMGSGVALAIRQRYPAAYDAYVASFEVGTAKMGAFSYADVGDGRSVINLYAQEHYGTTRRHLDYEGLYQSLALLKHLLQGLKDPQVLGVPYLLGCARAGGRWPIVLAMITDLFEASPIRCVIVRLPDVAA